MGDEHNIKSFTAADIEKYHKGLLSSKERHAMEKAALDDPFLADALEGYNSAANVSEDIAELKNRLSDKIEKSKSVRAPFPFPLWKIAAMIILIAGAGLLVYQLGFNNKQPDIAHANKNAPANTELKELKNSTADSVTTFNVNSASKDVAIQPEKDLKHKKIEQSGNLVTTQKEKENVTSKTETAKGDVAKALSEQSVSAAATAEPKTDDKENETKKSLRNDNAFDKTTTTEKPTDYKAKEYTLKKKVDADGDGVNDLFDKSEAKSKGNNANVKNQSPGFAFKTNIFRGRVTDTHNNPLPFTNITNLEDKVGTYTDARGYFTLTSPDSTLNVQVRSLGFETNNVQIINTRPENKILLEEDKSLSARVLDTVKRNTNRSRTASMILEEPEPLDGWSNYDTYLVNNLKVPESFRKKQAGGEVELSFEVNKNGEPVNITVKKSLCESCDKEAIRLIKEGPKWKRKMKKGKTTVTVTF